MERKVSELIEQIINGKERYLQEITAKEIMKRGNEEDSLLVADLLYLEDPYIRNLAIEILIGMDKRSLAVLEEKILDPDYNIRKFALDALKMIPSEKSCILAMRCLEDTDTNVVEAAIEVLAEQKYAKASEALLKLMDKTECVWILNALLRAFANIHMPDLADRMNRKISELNLSMLEKNLLMNSYINIIGLTGGILDLNNVVLDYVENYKIESTTLLHAISNLLLRLDLDELTAEIRQRVEELLTENWSVSELDNSLNPLEAVIKLQMSFFLKDFKKIYEIFQNKELVPDVLLDQLKKLKIIPDDFIKDLLTEMDSTYISFGLKLIDEKGIDGYQSKVEELCSSKDKEVSEYAIKLIATSPIYKNDALLYQLTKINNDAYTVLETYQLEAICPDDMEHLLIKLKHKNKKIRRSALEILMKNPHIIDIDAIENIVDECTEEEGLEALEVLFCLDAEKGWKYIDARMVSLTETVRMGLIEIIWYADNEKYYKFMKSMVNDPSAAVRKKSIKSLIRKGEEQSYLLLKNLYQSEVDVFNKMEIVSNLYRFPGEEAYTIVSQAATCNDAIIRIAAISSLLHFETNTNNTISILTMLLMDSVDDVRDYAREALLEMGVKQ